MDFISEHHFMLHFATLMGILGYSSLTFFLSFSLRNRNNKSRGSFLSPSLQKHISRVKSNISAVYNSWILLWLVDIVLTRFVVPVEKHWILEKGSGWVLTVPHVPAGLQEPQHRQTEGRKVIYVCGTLASPACIQNDSVLSPALSQGGFLEKGEIFALVMLQDGMVQLFPIPPKCTEIP